MSYLVAAPDFVASAATDLSNIGSAVAAANATAAAPTTAVVAAAGDEVSAAVASLFSEQGQTFQALGAQAAALHAQFVQLLDGGAAQYVSTEIANASPLQAIEQALTNAINTPAIALTGHPLVGNDRSGTLAHFASHSAAATSADATQPGSPGGTGGQGGTAGGGGTGSGGIGGQGGTVGGSGGGGTGSGGGSPGPAPFNPISWFEEQLVNGRNLLNSNFAWPLNWGTVLGQTPIGPALPVLDSLGLAFNSSIGDANKIIAARNSFTDLAGGVIKSVVPGPIGYLGGTAVSVWGDVGSQFAQGVVDGDYSSTSFQNTVNYVVNHPVGALQAATNAVGAYVPKLVEDLVPKVKWPWS
jgi:hypothetical protein